VPTKPIIALSISELQSQMASGALTSVELVQFYLDRIAAFDQRGPRLNAIQHANPQALEIARQLDAERAATGPRSLLHGIPVVVKDNYETVDMPTTAGSVLFEGFAPERDAFLVQRLREAGAVILAKTTMHEFAYGIITVGSMFGATRNPYDLQRNPGGSSGGTGAAVAAHFAAAGLGSDTCGSIRIPAAQNNLAGLRATQGLSSRRGIVPLSSTQDVGGPLARTVADLAIMLDATMGPDTQDAQTIAREKEAYLDNLSPRTEARIGLLVDWLVHDPGDEVVADVIKGALAKLAESAGWEVIEVPSPQVNSALDRAWNGHLVLIHDFKTDMESYLAANPELGYASVQDLIDDGRTHPEIEGSLRASAGMGPETQSAYNAELAQRQAVRVALDSLLETHQLDALAYPTIRQVAALIGQEQPGTNCRLSANSGLPAISVPAGFTAQGMPVGLELLAGQFSEQKLLNLALTVEQSIAARANPSSVPEL
jgi:Asp-tRNA(Asn)/Glu-tRNA(Gln) amidotransferase A subunit family amidase